MYPAGPSQLHAPVSVPLKFRYTGPSKDLLEHTNLYFDPAVVALVQYTSISPFGPADVAASIIIVPFPAPLPYGSPQAVRIPSPLFAPPIIVPIHNPNGTYSTCTIGKPYAALSRV